MNAITPVPSIIPETAPFSTRAARLAERLLRRLSRRHRRGGGAGRCRAAEPDEDFPWHDAALAMPERLELAKERKPERQLMAAMAQLDCGQCGYLCQTYAEAVWSGAEADMGRCVPGGKETQRKLKELLAALEPQRTGAAGRTGGEDRGACRLARPAGARHPGRRPSAQPAGLGQGCASRRVRPVDHRSHLRGG